MIYMENPTKQRYYLLYTEQDLFGTWCLIKSFGSLVSRRGRTIVQVCESGRHASELLFDVENKKRQRGYVYADVPHIDRFHLRPQTIKEVIGGIKSAKQPKAVVKAEVIYLNSDQLELF